MNTVYVFTAITCRVVFRLFFRWRVHNRERVPLVGPAILASNHASFVDPPMSGSPLPRSINYLARESLFKNPILRWYIESLSAVPVDRDGGGAKGLKIILDRLLHGEVILLFPEGTRTPNGQLQPVRSGVGLAVIKSDAPVIPVRLFGTYEAFGRHLKWPQPKPVVVKFGRPIDFSAARAEAKVCSKARLKDLYQEVADKIMEEIGRLEPHEDVDRFG